MTSEQLRNHYAGASGDTKAGARRGSNSVLVLGAMPRPSETARPGRKGPHPVIAASS